MKVWAIIGLLSKQVLIKVLPIHFDEQPMSIGIAYTLKSIASNPGYNRCKAR